MLFPAFKCLKDSICAKNNENLRNVAARDLMAKVLRNIHPNHPIHKLYKLCHIDALALHMNDIRALTLHNRNSIPKSC